MKQMAATSPHRVKDPEGTRDAILQAAFDEIHLNGFRAASLDDILEKAGVTKGALYHHFGSKNGLGLAVLHEIVHDRVLAPWLQGIQSSGNTLDGIISGIRELARHVTPEQVERGCPLNNLAQELSTVDEEFRHEIVAVFDEWQNGVAALIREGQAKNEIRADADPEAVATFIVASFQGSVGLTKTSRDLSVYETCAQCLAGYLETLRP